MHPTLSIGAFVVALEPVDPEPVGPDVVDAMVEGVDPSVRSSKLFQRAQEHADEQRFREAAHDAARAYELMPADKQRSDSGLFVIVRATEWHDKEYRISGDAVLLASLQRLLEHFLPQYEGLDPRIEQLQRDLEQVRNERLVVSDRYHRERRFVQAATEAGDCYRALQAVDKGRNIGERAVLAASKAYFDAWYADGDIRHIEAAIALVDDHLTKAGASASPRAQRQRASLERRLTIARARGGGIDDEGSTDTIAPQDRSFMLVSGAALGSSIGLAAGAAVVASGSFDVRSVDIDGSYSIRTNPEHIGTAIPLGVVGGVVAGLAIHSMVDAGMIRPRERKILAITATATSLLGLAVGTALLAVGATQQDDLRSVQARGMLNTGVSLMVGMGAPLGAGIAALVSRRAGAR